MSEQTPIRLCALCWERHPTGAQCIGMLKPKPMPTPLPPAEDTDDV